MTQEQAEEVIQWLFGGDRDVDIKMHSVKIVTCRAAHQCMHPTKYGHCSISPGEKAVREKALVDGQWGASYVCEKCAIAEWKGLTK